MIQIDKTSVVVPRILTLQGADQTALDCARVRRSAARYLSGEATIEWFDYHSRDTVKRTLMELQHRKCCYCEQRRRRSELAVDHFRPRTAVRQRKKGELIYPGYFWLAYSWQNLYLSCAECNTRFKSCYFPLANPGRRARGCSDPIAAERFLLIDPGVDNPRTHFRFRRDEMIGLTARGRATIEFLQLNEENLRMEREEKVDIMHDLLDIIELAARRPGERWRIKSAKARADLEKRILPAAEFSMMARDFLTDAGYL